MRTYDAAVIGGGLLGCFAARNLRRWELSVALFEAREDVCTGISRANTAIVYSGCDHKPGTLKAEMTVRANAGFDRLCRELDVPFSRCGSLMVSLGEKGNRVLQRKYEQGQANGVPGLGLLSGVQARELEPGLTEKVSMALYAPGTGTVNPWALGIAAGENAAANGAEFFFNAKVMNIRPADGGYILETERESLFCRCVLNCAGLAADRVQALLSPPPVWIAPNAGDYLVLDRATENAPTHIIQYEPEDGGKGINAVPTVEGSLLLGPTERENSTDYAVCREGLAFIRKQAELLLPQVELNNTIRSFAAVRPNPRRADGSSIGSFVIDNPAPGFWSFIGIKTPGLSCAEELGRFGAAKAADYLKAGPNSAFTPFRAGIKKARDMSDAQRNALIRENPDYGEILCQCEGVTKAEVLAAIRRGAVTVDGVKRRTGAGMGPCQGSRCQQRIVELLARELKIAESDVAKDAPNSNILGGRYETL